MKVQKFSEEIVRESLWRIIFSGSVAGAIPLKGIVNALRREMGVGYNLGVMDTDCQ